MYSVPEGNKAGEPESFCILDLRGTPGQLQERFARLGPYPTLSCSRKTLV